MNENQNDRREEGGLFSEEYEAPKRENPYLKKNREKAKAEKVREEKPKREKKVKAREESPYVPTSDTPVRTSPATEAAEEAGEEGYTRKRTISDFMFEHVKLIATVATIIVVLSLVLITDVVGLVENMITQHENAAKEEISLTYVQGLSQKSTPVTWDDVRKFRYDADAGDDYLTWRLSVKGTNYELWITGADTNRTPSAVWLIDMASGDRMNLGEDNFDTFIREHTKN